MPLSPHPRLRFVEAYPFEEDGQTFYYLRDPQEHALSPIVVNDPEFFILTLFDGRHSLDDIRSRFAERFDGVELPESSLRHLVEQLDTHFYLDNATFRKRLTTIHAEFHASPVRRPWHAGTCFADEKAALLEQMDEFYTGEGGAGLVGRPRSHAGQALRGILVPHIDLRVGAATYTHGYRDLAVSTDADLFVILGIAHQGGRDFFIATGKDFETPLGTVRTDVEVLERWRELAGTDVTREEIAHRTEHSIEFQLPFLQHRLDGRPFTILPVLCGSMYPWADRSGPDIPELQEQVAALGRAIRESGRKPFFILSVDLAHMGPKFGDPDPITAEAAHQIEVADRGMFDILARLDREAFFDRIRTDLLERNVDACSAAYVFLELMRSGSGELVAYDQNIQHDTGSIVTYGSMLFYGPD